MAKYGLVLSLILAFGGLNIPALADDAGLSVRAIGSRPSLIFTDGEKPNIKVQVTDGSGDVAVSFQVKDSYSLWQQSGSLAIKRSGGERVEQLLPVKFPWRGHYAFSLTAKCGGQTAELKTTAAVIYKPLPPDVNSPWAIFWYPQPAPGMAKEDVPRKIAESLRLLGASWVRFNFWEGAYGAEVKDGKVTHNSGWMMTQAREFRKAGLHILGEFAQMPKALSSSTDTTYQGDAGAFYSRVKPQNYILWDQMIADITREFSREIGIWEIWNEVDGAGSYWSGTPEEYVELVSHTSAAIRKGNPTAKVVAAGFTMNAFNDPQSKARTERMFDLGLANYLDQVSIHYTDYSRGSYNQWRSFLDKRGIHLPLVNTEERESVPLENLQHGLRSFKFIHIDIGYPFFCPLLNNDWSPSPAAVAQATGARLIGAKQFVRSEDVGEFNILYFGKKDPVAIVRRNIIAPASKLTALSGNFSSISIVTKPASASKTSEYVEIFGRAHELSNGAGVVPFHADAGHTGEYGKAAVKEAFAYITNCARVIAVRPTTTAAETFAAVAEAEDGKFDTAWRVESGGGWSGGKYLDIWTPDEGGDKGHYVELEITAPETAQYRVYFSGNALTRLSSPPGVSPFVWQFDNGEENKADKPLKVVACNSAPEGLSLLGKVNLTAGPHRFRLRLTAPRELYDHNYALWFDAIGLVKE